MKTIQKLEFTESNIMSLLIIIIAVYLIKENIYIERFRIGVQPSEDDCPRCGYGCDAKGKCYDTPQEPPPAPQILKDFRCLRGPGGTTSDGTFDYSKGHFSEFYDCYRDICMQAGYR